ncbi:type II toxin-antitoxin system HicA family toxin [Candidatus Poriferisodalis sp.]|uniref:type II toxin-antitoxin system HicA family toxin n=1 Tax=Candidatus Poriferisodalis sp. TaxID=3101277 RepID=UPI003B58C51D
MTDREFLRRLRRYARKRGIFVVVQPDRGKGSHARVWLGDRATTLSKVELQPGKLRAMLRQLGIDKVEF